MKSHDRIPPEIAQAAYSKSKELAGKGLGGIRIARQLSAAYAINVCPGTINHWIYGHHKPRLRNLFEDRPSAELSYIIGANKGDGCTVTASGCVKLEVTDKEFAEKFNSKMAALFSRDRPNRILVRTFETRRQPLFIVKYSSKKLVDLLRGPLNKLMNLALVFPSDFLRGFFDAEGFVEVAAQDIFDVRVGAENSNRTLLSGAKRMLESAFGIKSLLFLKRKSGTVKTIRGQSFLMRRTSFRLIINRLEDIRTFEHRIGFSITRKQKKLEDALGMLEIKGGRKRSIAWRELYSKVGGEWVLA